MTPAFRRIHRTLGQTTTEYALIVGLVAVPLAIIFMRETSRFLAGLIVKIVAGFSGNYAPP